MSLAGGHPPPPQSFPLPSSFPASMGLCVVSSINCARWQVLYEDAFKVIICYYYLRGDYIYDTAHMWKAGNSFPDLLSFYLVE